MTTPEKQALHAKLNQATEAAHQDASERAQRMGKPAPSAPAPLTLEQVEFPKWLHKGWEATDMAPGHHAPKESKLAHNADELKALVAKGFTEEPPKAVPAKPAKE